MPRCIDAATPPASHQFTTAPPQLTTAPPKLATTLSADCGTPRRQPPSPHRRMATGHGAGPPEICS
ncbi:hypothetical protein ABZP36_028339 [Zizania latifolia]